MILITTIKNNRRIDRLIKLYASRAMYRDIDHPFFERRFVYIPNIHSFYIIYVYRAIYTGLIHISLKTRIFFSAIYLS